MSPNSRAFRTSVPGVEMFASILVRIPVCILYPDTVRLCFACRSRPSRVAMELLLDTALDAVLIADWRRAFSQENFIE